MKKIAEVEKSLKDDLYRYLHDQGMEFTLEPQSIRGKIDVILEMTGGDRRYIEAKVYDGKRRNKDYLISGFSQTLEYLRQYNATSGYLLIYKTCEHDLVFDIADQVGTVQFVRCDGKTVYILVVDICEHKDPVSKPTSELVRIEADELIKAAIALP